MMMEWGIDMIECGGVMNELGFDTNEGNVDTNDSTEAEFNFRWRGCQIPASLP